LTASPPLSSPSVKLICDAWALASPRIICNIPDLCQIRVLRRSRRFSPHVPFFHRANIVYIPIPIPPCVCWMCSKDAQGLRERGQECADSHGRAGSRFDEVLLLVRAPGIWLQKVRDTAYERT
jgi:hypothetical protein